MGFCILRTAKMRSAGSLVRSLQHNSRERPPPNADPEKQGFNRFGTDKVTNISEPVSAVMQRYKAQLPEKVRKNAIHAIELVMTASPEFAGSWSDYLKACDQWAIKNFGGKENVLHVAHHHDETTPHTHMLIMPLHEGKLNSKHFIGGHRDRMREIQDDFYKSVGREFGLDRGLSKEDTKAQHRPPTLAIRAAELAERERKIKEVTGLSAVQILELKERVDLLNSLTPDALRGVADRMERDGYKTCGEAWEKNRANREREKKEAREQQQRAQKVQMQKKPQDRDFER